MDKVKKHRSHISGRRFMHTKVGRKAAEVMDLRVENKTIEDVVKGNKKGELQNCQGCGMCIGPGYIEKQSYQVGDYQICSWCLRTLERRGRLQVEPYNQYLFLYPDGEVSVEKKKVFVVDEEEDCCRKTSSR